MQDTLSKVTTDESGQQVDQHGFASFPVAFYHTDLSRSEVTWHWHDEIEIMQILEGQLLVGVGSATAEYDAETALLVKPGALHNAWKANDRPLFYRTIVFSPRLIGGIDSCIFSEAVHPFLSPDFPPLVVLSGESGRPFLSMLDAVWEAKETDERGFENEIRYWLTKLLIGVAGDAVAEENVLTDRETRDIERAKQMLKYIQQHYAQEVTLPQIAASASLGTAECLRCFKRVVGASPISVLKEYRLRCAASMLRTTNLHVSEIAAACGIADPTYFSKSFRARYGQSPTVYRRAELDSSALSDENATPLPASATLTWITSE